MRKLKRHGQTKENPQAHKMELFNMYRQSADMWRLTAELYSHVDGEKQHTEKCYRLGAEALENASALLAASTKEKELEIAQLEEEIRQAESEEG